MITGYREDGLWWFRIFGYGLMWVDHRIIPPLFSERNGFRRYFHVGPWCFRPLKPTPRPNQAVATQAAHLEVVDKAAEILRAEPKS